MAEYKNQHFVPQFYLNQFSNNSSVINLFDIDTKRLYKKGIKNICSGSYFYTKGSQFEACLSPLENTFKDVIIKLSKEKDLDKLYNQDYIFLLFFIGIQYTRTNKEKAFFEDFFDSSLKMELNDILTMSPKLAEYLGITKDFIDMIKDCKIVETGGNDQSVSHMRGMLLGLISPFLTYDLEPRLIINNTAVDFIISDHPIVLYNKYFNNKRIGGITGFASHGLQIFCPISPKVLFILY